MSRVRKIFGPPGTGKTTRLLGIVEEAMKAGTPPERIAYMAFTRKAAEEAVTRAKERFGFADDRFPWFRTLHSMAFKDLGARRDDIMQDQHYKELGDALGFQFTSLDDDFSFMPMGTALGDKVARIESLSRARLVGLSEQWHDSNYRDCPWQAVAQWAAGLARYKDSRGLQDYTDLLEGFTTPLDVDLFIVDEAQDLSYLQWKVVKIAAANANQVFLAGDDDQCLYDWAGADVGRFLRIKGDVEVLPHSFRLPYLVRDLAESVVQRIRVRQPKQWTGREERGRIDWLRYESSLDLSKGTWLLIARNHRALKRFEKVLRDQGYPYIIDNKHSTDNSITTAIFAWEAWRKGLPITPQQVREVASVLPALGDWSPKEDVLLRDAPLPEHIKANNWMDALTDITPSHREYIRACRANNEPLRGKPRITVATIHRIKGGEADHVALITDLSAQPWKALNTDEEQRVLYVAVTRCRESLTLIQPQSPRHYQL